MEDVIYIIAVLVVFIVFGFVAWKLLRLLLVGLGVLGKGAKRHGLPFMKKVMISITTGVIAGFLVTITTGAEFQFIGAASVGTALGAFVRSYIA